MRKPDLTWKDKARIVILATMKQALADGLDRDAMIKRVDAAYPFGQRRYYPYQARLAVRRALLFDGEQTPAPFQAGACRRPSEAAKSRAAGARGLFDEERPET